MFGLVGWQVKLAEFVVAGFLCFGAYKYIGHEAVDRYKTDQAILQAKSDKIQQDKYDAKSSELEALKIKRAEDAKVIHKTTERIINNQPITYASACLDDAGMQHANASIEGKSSTKPAPTVPSTK